jgi:hypothetical protein
VTVGHHTRITRRAADRPYDARVRPATARLLVFLLVTLVVTLAGALQKAPCANAKWVQGRSGGTVQCYSDVSDLLETEQLASGRVPYVDACAPAVRPCDEYPVLLEGVMWLAAQGPGSGDPFTRFYWINAALLIACALIVTWCLERLGARTMLFAAAPVLFIYGTMNWDLIPVALSMGALAFYAIRRTRTAGILLGVGAAAKVFPMLVLGPLAVDADRSDGRMRTARLVGWAAVAWLALNLPVAIAAPTSWWNFFRYNADRPAEYDTVWRAMCAFGPCMSTAFVGIASLVTSIALAIAAWRWRVRHDPRTPVWAAAFPLLVSFVLFNKVWSPQYALWLLPWFALVAPSFKPYLAWQASEALVYITRFTFFGALGSGSASYTPFAISVLVRAAILVWCLAAWARSTEMPASLARPPTEDLAPARGRVG